MSSYLRPSSLQDAVAHLNSNPDSTILAGGTDIYPARTARLAWGDTKASDILDISALQELRGIADRGDHWWIGALTTWSDIIRMPLPPLFDGLKAAARDIGGVQIQNRATIAGNCCTASPAGDSIPCLLTLDAEFELMSATQRCIPAAQFFTGYRTTALARNELVTGIRIPKRPGRGAFLKLGARRYLVISIAMIAGVVDRDANGRVITSKFAIGACSATAQRLPELETALQGRPLDPRVVSSEQFSHLSPLDDIRGSAGYRRHAAIELTRDLITSLATSTPAEAAHA